ncbi:MAG: orotidine 5'-phosphate decarboxylase, partial [Candidatus Heimdallarchaeota archaeon]
MNFFHLLSNAKRETGSRICVGLDLAAYGSRNQNTLKKDESKVEVSLDLVETLSPFCCAFKINRQYILDLSLSDIQKITTRAHECKRPVIIDHKISDIGSSNDQALLHFNQEGFDAFTASPFPGNIEEI